MLKKWYNTILPQYDQIQKYSAIIAQAFAPLQIKANEILSNQAIKTLQSQCDVLNKTYRDLPLITFPHLKELKSLSERISKIVLPQIQLYDKLAESLSKIASLDQLSFSNQVIQQPDIFRINVNESFIADAAIQIKSQKISGDDLNFGENVILTIDNIYKLKHFNEILDSIKKVLLKQSNKNPKSHISFSTFLNLLFFFLNLVFSYYMSNVQEKKLVERISQTEKNIKDEIKNLQPDIKNSKNKPIYCFVLRRLNVRNSPSLKGRVIDNLFPNNKVRTIKEQNNWVYIEYFDFINGYPKMGWVYSKFLSK